MASETYVLGVNLSHNGSACLLRDGEIVVAIEKERITRRKHDGLNDSECVVYCLDAAGIALTDVSLVVQNTWEGMFERGNSTFYGPRIYEDAVRTVTISHHLAHAFSAFGTCPFQESSVLVIDNGGNSFDEVLDPAETVLPQRPPAGLEGLFSEVDSFYSFGKGEWTSICKTFSPPGLARKPYPMIPLPMMHSVGGMYKAVSTYVFNGIDDTGKLMGLAPYGRPGQYDFPMFDVKDGAVQVRYDWMAQFDRPCHSRQQFKRDFQYYADIAYWTQREIERVLLALVCHRHELGPSKNLCYAGGVALNAVANRLILKFGPYENLYIQPASGDNGIAVGCCYYGWLQVLGGKRVLHNQAASFGAAYTEKQHSVAAERARVPGIDCRRSGSAEADAARLLAEGSVVAWFQGGCEFGPRALGNRSILADPRNAEIRDFINREIKNREDFRPFAPSVLAEDRNIYFDCDYDSPYMILIADVREEWRKAIPAVVHQDNTARIQTVTAESNPRYYKLLVEFKKLTGLGVLLNTSLNKRGQPIVETPDQAVALFLESKLHALVMDDWILSKKDLALDYRINNECSDTVLRSMKTPTCRYVLNMASGRVFRLQGAAASVWEWWQKHSRTEDLIEAASSRFGLSPQAAEKCFQDLRRISSLEISSSASQATGT